MDSNDRTIRWGIVGLGAIVVNSIAPAIAESKSGRLTACMGRTPEGTLAFAERFGVPGRYEHWDALARDPEVDVVYVATPNALHHEPVIAAARGGKHVLCEKPFAMTEAQGRAMVDACREAGVILRVAHQIRLEPTLKRARELIQSGVLGELRTVTFERTAPLDQRGAWRRDPNQGGIVFDVAVHLLDLVQWTTGESIREVCAFSNPDRREGRPDETVSILGRLGKGCSVQIRASREIPYSKNDFVVEGTKGMLSTSALRWVDAFSLQVKDASGVKEEHFVPAPTYRREVEVFEGELRGERSVLPDGEDGVAMIRLTNAILESIQTRRAVSV